MSIPGQGGEGGGQWTPPLGDMPGPGGEGGYYPPPPKKSNLVWILLGCGVASFFGIMVVGILAAIAIPNFLKFSAKAKQSEAKTNLGALFTSQIAYFGENNAYAGADDGSGESCFDKLRWAPEGDAMYSYYCDGDVLPCTKPGCDPCANETDLSATDDQSFVIMAVGNIDHDGACDVWTMDDSKILQNVSNDNQN